MIVEKNAYAKINLTLDLTCTLPDRYHGIFTVMQSIGIYDKVTVETVESGTVIVSCSDKSIPCDERNTAYKAARFFLQAADINSGVKIFIDKKIPSQAGLAGGSADAAAVLSALADVYRGMVTDDILLDIALKIGADVPFCLVGGTRLCQNKGEVMSRLPEFNAWVVTVKPDENISTKEAYMRFDTAADVIHPDNDGYLFYASQGDYIKAAEYADNIFESLSAVYSGDKIKKCMYGYGAFYSAMSGSGSAFFGLFTDRKNAEKAAEELKKDFDAVFVCKTENKGIS